MNWKKWKVGLLIAIITGAFTALAGLAAGISWKQFAIIVAVSIGKDALLYLKEHPVDKIDIAPLLLFGLILFLPGCAIYRPQLETQIQSTNGVATSQRLSATAIAIWPATTDITKQKMSVGKTLSLGVEGLHEEGGGTNLVEGLKQLNDLIGKFK